MVAWFSQPLSFNIRFRLAVNITIAPCISMPMRPEAFENSVEMLKQLVQVKKPQQRMENDIWAQLAIVPIKTSEHRQLKSLLGGLLEQPA